MEIILPNNVVIKISHDHHQATSSYGIIDGDLYYYIHRRFIDQIFNKQVMAWVLSDVGLEHNLFQILHLINAWESKENGFQYYVSTDDYHGKLEDHCFDNYDDASLFFLQNSGKLIELNNFIQPVIYDWFNTENIINRVSSPF